MDISHLLRGHFLFPTHLASLFPLLPLPTVLVTSFASAPSHALTRTQRERERELPMSVGSWCIRAIPGAAPPARAGLLGSAFLQVFAARPRTGRCRAAQHGRVRLGGSVVARAGAAETPVAGTDEDAGAAFSETFPLRRCQAVAFSTPDALRDLC